VKKLSSELSTCHDIIANLRNENASLIAKVDSNICDISIPNLRNNNVNLLAKIEELNVSLASFKIENEKLIAKAKELDVCNASISDLRDNNDILRAKIVEINSCKPSTSTIEHVTICTRCRDINIDAIHDHMALIKQQNDDIAELDAKIVEHDLENGKFKFARSMPVDGDLPRPVPRADIPRELAVVPVPAGVTTHSSSKSAGRRPGSTREQQRLRRSARTSGRYGRANPRPEKYVTCPKVSSTASPTTSGSGRRPHPAGSVRTWQPQRCSSA
jgi:hypothetical protein